MSKKNVLIVDDNPLFASELRTYLEQYDFNVLEPVRSGKKALETVKKGGVDIITMDLIIPEMDGFEVLEELNQLPDDIKPYVFVITALSADFFVTRTALMDARYFMTKPMDFDIICRRILDFSDDSRNMGFMTPGSLAEKNRRMSVHAAVTDIIRMLAIPANILGYQQVRNAIEFVIERYDNAGRKVHYGVTTHVYPAVAKLYGTTPSRVERNIRNAIEIAWDRANIKNLQSVFGFTIDVTKGRPTNSEFIAMIVDKVTMMTL